MRIFLLIGMYMLCLFEPANAQTGLNNTQKKQQQSSLTNEIENGLTKVMDEYTYKPNTEATWKLIRNDANNFMYELYRKRRLMGDKPKEAYFIKIGLETMTEADIAANKKKLVAGFAAIKPAEFTIVQVETKPKGKY